MANRNIRVVLAYDGTDFCGWQSQSYGRTVQDAFERALEAGPGHRVGVHLAGATRTARNSRAQEASQLRLTPRRSDETAKGSELRDSTGDKDSHQEQRKARRASHRKWRRDRRASACMNGFLLIHASPESRLPDVSPRPGVMPE